MLRKKSFSMLLIVLLAVFSFSILKVNAAATSTLNGGSVATTTTTNTTVDTTPPVITGAQDLTVQAGSKLSVLTDNVSVTDQNDPHPTLTVTYKDGNAIKDLGTPGSYQITYTATDASGNTTTKTVNLSVIDTTAPVISVPKTITILVFSGKSEITALVNVTDNASAKPTLTYTGNVDLNKLGSYNVVFTATDASGNSSTAKATIKVVDMTRPVISGVKDLTVVVGSNLSVLTANVKATDNYDKNPTLTVKLANGNNVDLDKLGTYTIVYTATDSSGNAQTATAQLTVVDKTAPVIKGIKNVTITKGQSFNPLNGITATDNVDSASQIKLKASSVDLNKLGEQTVTITATDTSGNTATATYNLTINYNYTWVYIVGAVIVLGAIVGGAALLKKKTN